MLTVLTVLTASGLLLKPPGRTETIEGAMFCIHAQGTIVTDWLDGKGFV